MTSPAAGLAGAAPLTASASSPNSRRWARTVPWLLGLVGSALVAVLVAELVARHNESRIRQRLAEVAEHSRSLIGERIRLYEYGLRGARGAVVTAGADQITRAAFRRYMSTRNMATEFPGAHGFGFIRKVPLGEVSAFETHARSDGAADFAVRYLSSHLGDRFVIQYIEPESSNGPAIGLDIASEPVRRLAAQNAQQLNAAVLTGPVTLVQEPLTNGGVLFLLPVYSAPRPGPQGPLASELGEAVGWVYAPLLLKRVFEGLDPANSDQYVVRISDQDAQGHLVPTFESQPQAERVPGRLQEFDTPMFGRQWHMAFQPTTAMIDRLNLLPVPMAALIAFATSVLLFTLAHLYRIGRQRARLAQEGHAKLAAIVESSVDAIIGKSTDGTVTSWNRAAEQLFGYAREEAVGRRLVDLIIPEDLVDEESRILGRIAAGERIAHFETVRRRKDGSHVDVSVAISPICAADGRIVGASKTVRDIGRQKEAERHIHRLNTELETQVEQRTAELGRALETARQATRAKSQFLANMSHEIRTPLNAVLGLAYLTERESRENGTRDRLQKISRAGRSLLNLINDILDHTKIEEGLLKVEQAPFDLQKLLDNIATLMGSAAQNKSVEVMVGPAPKGVRHLLGDGFRIEQILINLVGNAIKFTDEGHVELSVRVAAREGDRVVLRFSVEDSGIGIPPETVQRLFRPFTQADVSTSRRFGGTGLGLSICKQLVELMGGEIGVESAVGHGSQFWFTVSLPLLADPPPHSQPPARHVLVAVSQERTRDNIVRCVQSLGWKDSAAASAEEIRRVLRSAADKVPVDVVLLEWQGGDFGDEAFARGLRRSDGEGPVLLAVVPVSRAHELPADGAGAAFDAVLHKPVTPSTLLDGVHSALGQEEFDALAAGVPTGQERLLAGVRLLVVDDNEINRELAKSILSSHGAQVDTLPDGRAAVSALEARHDLCDIVLMDLQMPELDGMEATSLIRQLPGCERLPIVALTAGAFSEQREAALGAGMDAVVTKPFDVDELVRLLVRLARRDMAVPDASSVPVPSSPDPGTELPVLDFTRGLQLWQDLGHYRHFLRRFLLDHEGEGRRLSAFGREEALARVHRTRGSAAGLALPALSRAASRYEEHLRQGERSSAETDRYLDALRRTCVAISEHLQGVRNG